MVTFFLVFLMAFSLQSLRADNIRNLGSFAGVLDRMGAGIAELGAGNTGTARLNSSAPSYWNPAILAFNRKTHLTSGVDMRTLNRNGGYVSISGLAAPNLGVGVSVVNRGDYTLSVWDKDENLLGTARPQDISAYIGLGLKTSRRNSFGLAVQWFQENMDLGGEGNKNIIGMFNFGWLRSWSKELQTAVVLRNIGINKKLSANYEFTSLSGGNASELDQTGKDFLPKTFVAAVKYTLPLEKYKVDTYFEYLDFQLDEAIFVPDFDHHAMGLRFGREWWWHPKGVVRAGYDRNSLSIGLGYTFKFRRRKLLVIDYALVSERNIFNFNPQSLGFKFTF